MNLRRLATSTTLLLLLLPAGAAADDDDDLTYRVLGFSRDGKKVLFEERFTRGHVGGGHVKLVLYSALSGKRLRAVTTAASTGDNDPKGPRELVGEALGKKRRRALLARLKLVPGVLLDEKNSQPRLRFSEKGPSPSLPEWANKLKGQTRRVKRTLTLTCRGRKVVLWRRALKQKPSVNSHNGIPYWPGMSLGRAHLSPDRRTLAREKVRGLQPWSASLPLPPP